MKNVWSLTTAEKSRVKVHVHRCPSSLHPIASAKKSIRFSGYTYLLTSTGPHPIGRTMPAQDRQHHSSETLISDRICAPDLAPGVSVRSILRPSAALSYNN
ncbi:hypothetical protein PCASD_16033 [Puccinia coronata f. sp. avenae]|uniref:Uncharacterized protein n=1 Tax=Puccinia coronata f. sp. avenae TaxID=200324 RepID=A0A2N5TZY5_9BASI|nr:hypothetical protein PCASD_16033 [Puccinia coronata f. sp. avenae]